MSRKAQWPESLRHLDLFADCTPAELRRVGSLLTMLTVPAGTVLMTEGTIGLEFMIIDQGVAGVSVGRGAAAQPVAELGAGEFVGEMSLLARSRRSATVTALTSLTLFVSNVAEFATLIDVAPGVRDKITRAAASRSAELLSEAA